MALPMSHSILYQDGNMNIQHTFNYTPICFRQLQDTVYFVTALCCHYASHVISAAFFMFQNTM